MQGNVVAIGEREKVVEAYRKSGLTQEEFAKKQGLNVVTLRSWIYRPARKSRGAGKAKGLRFIEVQAQRQVGSRVIIRFGRGLELELDELPAPEYLAALVRAAC